MSTIFQKISRLSFVFIPSVFIGYSSSCYADTMPDGYKFLPPDTVASINFKTSEASWPVLSLNKSLKKIDFLKELKSGKNDNPMDIILDPQVKDNLGNNLLVSLSAIDFSKDPQIMMVVEMKNASKTDYIKSKFNKMYLSKKDGKMVETKFRDTKIYSYVAKDPKNTKYDASYLAFFKNYVLMTNSFNSIQDSIKSYSSEIKGLSYSSDFVKSYDKLGPEHQVQLYLNMKKLAKIVSTMDNKNSMAKDMDLSMFKNLFSNNSLMVNFQLNPENIDLKTYSIADKSTDYYKTLQQSKPSDFNKYSNYLPKNALLFFGISDLKEAGHNLKELLAFDEKFKFEDLIQGATGIDIFSFANNLKNDMAIAAFNTDSNPLIPGIAFFMTPIDKGKMDLMFKSIKVNLDGLDKKKADKGNRKKNEGSTTTDKQPEIMEFSAQTTYKDITIYQTNELADMTELNARPAYAYIGEDLILASNEEAIKTIIDRSSVTTADFTLNANTSYLKLKESFGNSNNSIFYLNLATIINMVSSFLAGEKDSKDLVTNLKKFEAVGSSSVNDVDGSMGHVMILADLKSIDFNKLMPPEKKKKPKTEIKKKNKK